MLVAKTLASSSRILTSVNRSCRFGLFTSPAPRLEINPLQTNPLALHTALPHPQSAARNLTMADKYIPEHRRTTFKAKSAFKPDELRRRREEQQVEIRRAKREENLAKRRGIAGRDQPGASLGAAPDSDDEGGNIESQVSYPSYACISMAHHPTWDI
jgi:hypothetical protein